MKLANSPNEAKVIRRAIELLESNEPTWVLERSGMAQLIAGARAHYGWPSERSIRRGTGEVRRSVPNTLA